MQLRELMSPETRFSEVFTEYLKPIAEERAASPIARKPKATPLRDIRENPLILVIAPIFFLLRYLWAPLLAVALLFSLSFTILGWFLAVNVLLIGYYKDYLRAALAYTLWFLSHPGGVAVYAVTTIACLAASIASSMGGTGTVEDVTGLLLALPFACMTLLALVVNVLIFLTLGKGQEFMQTLLGNLIGRLTGKTITHKPKNSASQSSPLQIVQEKLPLALMDYYAPPGEYRRPRPKREDFRKEEHWQRAVAKIEAAETRERLKVVQGNILELMESETDEGVVYAVLRVRANGTDEQLVALAPAIAAHMMVYDVMEHDHDARKGIVGLRIDTTPQPSPVEKLMEMTTSQDFFRENPSGRITAWTAGIDLHGQPYTLPLAHTVVLGQTGAGKGSLFRGITCHLAPYVEQGMAEMYMIDPKNGEAKEFRKISPLFKAIERDSERMADVVDEIYARMKKRQEADVPFKASPNNPVIVLEADEIFTLKKDRTFSGRKDPEMDNMTTWDKLMLIGAQGRSDGVYIFAASQNATKAVLDELRDNLVVRIMLRVENPYNAANYFLGVQDTSAITPIPDATTDDTSSAGIGYIKNSDGGGLTLMRLGYMSDEAFAEMGNEYGSASDAQSVITLGKAPERSSTHMEEEQTPPSPSYQPAQVSPEPEPVEDETEEQDYAGLTLADLM